MLQPAAQLKAPSATFVHLPLEMPCSDMHSLAQPSCEIFRDEQAENGMRIACVLPIRIPDAGSN